MSEKKGEGEKAKKVDSITALTKKGLKVDLDITVLYRLKQKRASDVYRNLGKNYVKKVIRPKIRTSIRDTIAGDTAKDIYSIKRTEIAGEIHKDLKETLEDRGIIAEKVLLRNVKLPKKLADSIEKKLSAEQEALRMKFVLQKEKKERERKEIEAEGIKKAQDIISESLTPAYLRYYSIEMMKKLAQSDNSTYLFVPTDENGMPIVNVKPSE